MSLSFAVAGGSALWYLARGTGVVTQVLFTAVVVLGIMGPLRVATERWPRFAIDTLHRDISLLAVALLAVHVITSVLDAFAPIRLIDAVIPFFSPYRPLWLGLGAVALDLMVAVLITSLIRLRLGYAAWRAIHWLAYASWPVAILHGLGTGTDPKQWWMLALTALCVAAVAGALLVRIARSREQEGRGVAVAATLASLVGIAVFTLAGPLQPGWASRAGTPARLLGGTASTSASTASAPAAPDPRPARLNAPFNASASGTLTTHNVSGGELLDLDLHLGGSVHGRLRIRLAGRPLPGGGLSLAGSQVDFTANGLAGVLQGRVLALEGQSLTAHVAGSGRSLVLHADLRIPQNGGSVSGTISGQDS